MHAHAHVPAIAQIANLLTQLAAMIDRIDDRQYRAERAREVSGSVGGHVRHCLDHIAALTSGLSTARIDYDARLRGTAIESRRDAAIHETRRLRRRLEDLHDLAPAMTMDVVLCTDQTGTTIVARSTLARELAFVASHTVHHFAIVALLLREMGVAVPPRFGYAPSTPTPELAA